MNMNMNMNTNMGITVYWHKNQVSTRLKLQITSSHAAARISNLVEFFRTYDPIKTVLKTQHSSVDMQLIDVRPLCQPDPDGNADFVFYHRINPGPDKGSMHGNDGAAGMSNDDHSSEVISLINNNSMRLLSEFKDAIFDIFKRELKPGSPTSPSMNSMLCTIGSRPELLILPRAAPLALPFRSSSQSPQASASYSFRRFLTL